MKNTRFWIVECKLTCMGGSEKGTCSCRGPLQCKGKKLPGFSHARNEAVKRMGRHMLNMLEKNDDNDQNLHTRRSTSEPGYLQ